MNLLVDIVLDSGALSFALRDVTAGGYRVTSDGKKRITSDGSYRRISASIPYRGDLMEDIEITKSLPDVFFGVEQTEPVHIRLMNVDNGLDDTWETITAADELRGREVLIRDEDLQLLARGKITGYNMDDVFSIAVNLRDDESLETLLPPAVVTTDEFTTMALDIGFPISICFGHAKDIPLRNIQNNLADDHYDYLIGYGTLESLWIDHENNRGVKRKDVLVNTSEYIFYDGSQVSPYPGYAFLRFVKEQKDFSGGYYTLTADVKGMEMDGETAERNFANVIKELLTNTTWGLGQDVDTDSFTAAAAALPVASWMCDGAVTAQQKTRDVLDDLLFVARSSIELNKTGKWEITVDGEQSSVASFGEHDGYFDNCEITSMSITPVDASTKRGVIKYDQKEINLDIQDFGADKAYLMPFVTENVTAKKVLSYIYGRQKYADKKISMNCDLEAKDRKCGEIIEITSPARALTASEYRIISTTKKLAGYSMRCEAYDSHIFDDQTIADPAAQAVSPVAQGLRSFAGTSFNAENLINVSYDFDGSGHIGRAPEISWDANGNITMPSGIITTIATDVVLGRASAGPGAVEELVCTAFGKSLIAAANAAAGRSVMGALGNVVEDITPEAGGEFNFLTHAAGFTLRAVTGSGGSTTIDWRTGNTWRFTFGGNNEFLAFTAPTNKVTTLLLAIKQDAEGGRDITWPDTVTFLGTAPAISDGIAAKTIIVSFYWDGATYWGQATPWET